MSLRVSRSILSDVEKAVLNSDMTHYGMCYHIQTEVWECSLIVTQVFNEGKVVFKKELKANNEINSNILSQAHDSAMLEFKELLI